MAEWKRGKCIRETFFDLATFAVNVDEWHRKKMPFHIAEIDDDHVLVIRPVPENETE